MRIGILGSGAVGRDLGTGLARHGHDVMIGSRTPGSTALLEWASHCGGKRGTSADAASHGEVVILATAWTGARSAIDLAGADNLSGKTVIDVTNPLDHAVSPPVLAVAGSDSAGEQVQRWLPDSRVVKAFNIINSRFMIDPEFPGGPPTMFVAGNDEDAKSTVARLLESVGWEVADLGPIVASRWIEGLAMCWIWFGYASGTWDHALRLLRK